MLLVTSQSDVLSRSKKYGALRSTTRNSKSTGMNLLLNLLLLFPLFVVCEGDLQALPVKGHASVCTGDTTSLEVAITGAQGDPTVEWLHENSFLDDSEHFSLNVNKTVLDISDALPPHAGNYYAVVTDGQFSDRALFSLEVYDIFLHTKVKSPINIEGGGKTILKVAKSDGGVLWWIHRGELIRGQDSHYTFVDTQGSTGTELEISDAGAEQSGLYEVVLKEAGCEIRNVIDVQVEVHVEVTEAAAPETEPSKFWGIIDYKYLKVFSGDFTGQWYIAPAVLAPIVILFLVLIICLIRRSRRRKRSKKDKDDVEIESTVTRVVFEEPIYTMQDQVYGFPAADPTYDVITPVTSSHPQSSSLGAYGDMSIYGDSGMSTYDSLTHGPPVPPPTSGLTQTYSAMSDIASDFSDD